ncbi:MAG: hypothetical protein ACK2U9_15030, partial [Anaerolineae bacterium]
QALTEINTKVNAVLNQLPRESQQPVISVSVGETIDSMYIGFYSEDLPANLTLVREGEGEFYSTLGDDICQVTLTENRPEAGREAGVFRVSGTGECARPIPAVAREGEVRVRPFSFTGRVLWPAEAENVP